MSEQAVAPIFELRAVSKRYGGAVALENVDFDLRSGEIHGLIGENGAGKSTMMKLLSGVYNDYSGEMLLDGEYGPLEAGQQEAVQKLLDAAQDVNKILHASQITFSLD